MKQLYLLLFLMGTFCLSAQQDDPVSAAQEARIRLHPNPATGDMVYVQSESNAPKTVRIFDLFGKVVLERRLLGDALAIDRLVPGVYMVRIQQEGKYATKKLVVR